MYSVVVGRKVGVVCKSCGEEIEVEDPYIPGVRAAEMAAFYKPITVANVVNEVWQKTLTCENPDCGKTYEYRSDDLRLYD